MINKYGVYGALVGSVFGILIIFHYPNLLNWDSQYQSEIYKHLNLPQTTINRSVGANIVIPLSILGYCIGMLVGRVIKSKHV